MQDILRVFDAFNQLVARPYIITLLYQDVAGNRDIIFPFVFFFVGYDYLAIFNPGKSINT